MLETSEFRGLKKNYNNGINESQFPDVNINSN